jgi:hypothetical protein
VKILAFLQMCLAEVSEWEEGEFKHNDLGREIGFAQMQLENGQIDDAMSARVISGLLHHVAKRYES